jgi:hypothetical protein
VSEDDILYAFDVVLRYPLYGELVGRNNYFLAHPIRAVQSLPTMMLETASARRFALSLEDIVAAMAPSMTLDEYTAFLHEARGIIREKKIHLLDPDGLERETIREIAADLRLPARLSHTAKVMGVAAGVIGIAGASPVLGPSAAVLGGIVSVASVLWTGTVGRDLSRSSWLRWGLEWDIEDQASDAVTRVRDR